MAEFIAFYRQSTPRLVAFLRWQGASLFDAAECAQEALTQAFENWSTINYPHAWCRRVSSLLYVRWISEGAKPFGNIEDIESSGSPLISPEMDVDAFEQHHSVLRILDRLPARQRQVMAWVYDGATHTEIADALKISLEAVRGSLKKARRALRNYLQGNGSEI